MTGQFPEQNKRSTITQMLTFFNPVPTEFRTQIAGVEVVVTNDLSLMVRTLRRMAAQGEIIAFDSERNPATNSYNAIQFANGHNTLVVYQTSVRMLLAATELIHQLGVQLFVWDDQMDKIIGDDVIDV